MGTNYRFTDEPFVNILSYLLMRRAPRPPPLLCPPEACGCDADLRMMKFTKPAYMQPTTHCSLHLRT
eukprot:542567-Pleurochrysis_carterae.AAC.1